MIACGAGVLEMFTRPMVSGSGFMKLYIPPLTIDLPSVIINDATYDPIDDHIYWIESTVDYKGDCQTYFSRPTCPVITNIRRCDYNGRDDKLLVQGITPGVYGIGRSKY